MLAMKQVPASEYNPTECIATNIIGAQNLIDASIINNVDKTTFYQLIKQQTQLICTGQLSYVLINYL